MQNKFNIDDVNAWLKKEYGMSYDELLKEFNKAVDLLSESLKQKKEMRNKIDKANKILNYPEFEYDNCPDSVINEVEELKNILKEDK